MDNDEHQFISPPFPVIFLTVLKVVIAVALIAVILGGIGFAVALALGL